MAQTAVRCPAVTGLFQKDKRTISSVPFSLHSDRNQPAGDNNVKDCTKTESTASLKKKKKKKNTIIKKKMTKQVKKKKKKINIKKRKKVYYK